MNRCRKNFENRVSVSACVSLIALLLLIGCGRSEPDASGPVAAAPVQGAPAVPAGAVAQAQGGMPHGDHNPHHGGIVMMKGDLHFEVVSNPAGRYNLFFTDATRADLPAAIAQAVALTVHRANGSDEPIAMHIDDSGESWEGVGQRVDDAADATVRVSFTLKGDQPYWIDLPYVAPAPKAP